MFDPRQVQRSFSAAAGSYRESSALQQEIESRLLERLEFVGPLEPATVLDLGAGPGRASALLAQRFEAATVLAIDLSLAMLDQVEPDVVRVAADAQKLPLADDSVDLVFSNLMLQWCPDTGAVMAEISRVLKPGGVLIFSTYGPDTLKELRAAWASVDSGARVSSFIDMHHLGDGLLASGFSDPVVDSEVVLLTYAEVAGLMADLKAWGAHNLRTDRPRGLTGRQRLADMQEIYASMRTDDGRIPATFEIVYGYARGAPEGQPRRTGQGEEASFSVSHLRRSRTAR